MLENIKKEAKIAKDFHSAYQAVINVAQGSMVSNVIRVVALVLLGVGWVILRKHLISLNIERARQLSEQERADLKKYLTEIGSKSDDSVLTDLENGF